MTRHRQKNDAEGKYAIGLGGDIVSTKTQVFLGNDDYVCCTVHFSSFFVLVCQ